MKQIKEQNTSQRFIRIKAESDIYSVNEVIAEEKAVPRLIKIRNLFSSQKTKMQDRFPEANLTVKTWVVNPELPLTFLTK